MSRKIGHRQSSVGNRRHGVTSYWERTLWPLQSLYFLSPLLIGYEIATVAVAGASGGERLPAIYAERLLGRFFELFGATGYYLPGVLVVGVLLAMHVLRGDPWKAEPKLYLGMLIESVVWALPLFVLGTILSGAKTGTAAPAMILLQQTVDGGGITLAEGMVYSVGAGIYEELMFRVIAIAVLHLLLDDVLALPEQVGKWGAIIGSALLFSFYHFGGDHPFEWGRFVFYTLAGLYFAVLYVGRGFGIVAATHALYDILAVASQLNGQG